ncbi:peptidase, M23 family [Enterococcus termitis]|nr:peptidase, M23 family [Enterococcus termitis]
MSDCISCIVTEEENGQYEAELEFPTNAKYADYLQEYGYQIKTKPSDEDDYMIFDIYDHFMDVFTKTLTVKAKSRTNRLGRRAVGNVVISNKTGMEAMRMLENGMDADSDIELYSDIQTRSSTTFEVTNPLSCIGGSQGSMLQLWGGEIKHEPFKLSLLKRRGRDNVTTVRYGKDLEGLTVDLNYDGLLTRILPYADLQNDQGVTERIYGSPVDSKYIGNYEEEIFSRYVQFTEDQGVTDKASLNKVAKNYFTSMNPGVDKPSCQLKVNIRKLEENSKTKKFADFRKLCLCDTFTVVHQKTKVDITAKVRSIKYDSLLEKVVEISAGDERFTFFEDQVKKLEETMKAMPTKQYASSFVDYITDLINGVDGGAVYQYPKNRPYATYYLDTDSIDTAKDVVVLNSKGIGFSRKGWKGPFDYGWTIDGILNANFIKTGILEGIEVHSKNDNYDIGLNNGAITFRDKKDEIIGVMEAAQFGDAKKDKGITITQRAPYSYYLKCKYPDGSEKTPFHIVSEKIDGGQWNDFVTTNMEGLVQVNGALYVTGKIFLNGKEITGNGSGSGGGGGGGVPPELTTDQEKNAWAVWQFFKEKGWSIESIAGMLGNMQSESGIMPDIDEISGGGGYGLVQWTPKSKLVDWCNERGLDHRTLDAQCQRIQWEMENNVQWFPNYERPDLANISFREFTQLKDVKLAAEYFIAFYEHPKDVHQPIRGTQAQYWYDKLKDLKPPTAGWLSPVRANYVVTQEWDEPDYNSGGAAGIHGGIDLASVPAGSTPDIYAANSGTIMTVGSNPALEGNYIMIDHGNSYYTYYGHLSSINVKQGEKVTNATVIGVMGTTGASTGVHLHFEVRRGGSTATSRINPRDVITF